MIYVHQYLVNSVLKHEFFFAVFCFFEFEFKFEFKFEGRIIMTSDFFLAELMRAFIRTQRNKPHLLRTAVREEPENDKSILSKTGIFFD